MVAFLAVGTGGVLPALRGRGSRDAAGRSAVRRGDPGPDRAGRCAASSAEPGRGGRFPRTCGRMDAVPAAHLGLRRQVLGRAAPVRTVVELRPWARRRPAPSATPDLGEPGVPTRRCPPALCQHGTILARGCPTCQPLVTTRVLVQLRNSVCHSLHFS